MLALGEYHIFFYLIDDRKKSINQCSNQISTPLYRCKLNRKNLPITHNSKQIYCICNCTMTETKKSCIWNKCLLSRKVTMCIQLLQFHEVNWKKKQHTHKNQLLILCWQLICIIHNNVCVLWQPHLQLLQYAVHGVCLNTFDWWSIEFN